MFMPLQGFEGEAQQEDSIRVVPVMFTKSYVLFPGSTVSIVTSQPSDIAMAEQALERGEQVGILLKKMLPGLERNLEEGWYEVGCLGMVSQVKLVEEAKYAITFVGTQRFRVQREVADYPFPIFVVQVLNDLQAAGYVPRMRKLRTLMEELFLDIYRLTEDQESRVEWILELLDTTFELDEEDFMNVVCSSMPISTLEKQMLLEYSIALERFEKAAEILEFEHTRKLLGRAALLGGGLQEHGLLMG